MRASSANRILLWIVVGIGIFALLLLLTGDPQATELLRIFVVVAITIGGLWWLGYHARVLPRRESFEAQARELGLRARRGDPLGVLDLPFTLFRWAASVREIENTAQGSRGGLDLAIVDYWFAPTGDTRYDDYERYTCVLSQAPRSWPDLSVVTERIVSRLRSTFAMPDIRTESEEFNRRFAVRSNDRRFALAFLDARMMAWLLEQVPGVGFEVLGGTAMLFRPRSTTSLDDLVRAVELYDRFHEKVPRVVRAEQL